MSEIDELKAQVARLEARLNSLTLGKLDSASETISRASFISPADASMTNNPTSEEFTGVAMGGQGWTFNSVIWHLAAVASGVLQVGINYLGQFLAGAGDVIIDANGIYITPGATALNRNKIRFGDYAYIQNVASVPATANAFDMIAAGSSSGRAGLVSLGGGNQAKVYAYSSADEQYVRIEPIARLPEVASTGTPASGYVYVYPKTDGKLYYKDDAGTEKEIATV